jgi:pimeloyl-ACP methyl ester carboxylesterase
MRIVRFWCLAYDRGRACADDIRAFYDTAEGIARLEIIAGAGHFTWKDAPDRYWPMIIQFINGTIGPELAVA